MNTPIKNSLARLPYQEMMHLSREIAARLGGDEKDIADTLSSLEIDSSVEERDAFFLNMAFTRKKQITIQPVGDGFKVAMPSVEGAEVIGTNVRACISQLLDHIVVYNALMNIEEG